MDSARRSRNQMVSGNLDAQVASRAPVRRAEYALTRSWVGTVKDFAPRDQKTGHRPLCKKESCIRLAIPKRTIYRSRLYFASRPMTSRLFAIESIKQGPQVRACCD